VGEIRGMRPTDPAQVAGYRLTGILGEGGQGTVYLGEDEGGRHVAVKMVHPHLLIDDQVALDGILREVQIAGRLARFCTAQVITTGEEDGRPYVVSEYVSGPTLEESVRSEGPRSEASLHRLGVATATALSAIHQAGVLHRDFKPHNVILGPDGPVVIDFGIARVLNSAVRSTMTGQLLGTPSYVAPEQIRHLATGPESDVFAWACTMVFAATGQPPFGGSTWQETFRQVVNDEPELGDIQAPLRDLLAACLAKDPEARPTIDQVLRELTERPDSDFPAPVANLPAKRSSAKVARRRTKEIEKARHPKPVAAGVTHAMSGDNRRPWVLPVVAVLVVLVLVAAGLGIDKAIGSAAPVAASTHANTIADGASSSPTPSPSHAPKASASRSAKSAKSAGSNGTTAASSPASQTPASQASSSGSTQSSAPQPVGPDLAANGSFETGSLSPWTDTSDSSVIKGSAESGEYLVQMDSQGGGAGVAQTITGLTPGDTYELIGWVASGSPAATTYIGVKFYSSTNPGGADYTTSGTSWSEGVITFTPAAGYTSAQIWCWRKIAGIGYCDNLSVYKMS
jgi:serine/threonine protein kinase